jgi:hypothetical protein
MSKRIIRSLRLVKKIPQPHLEYWRPIVGKERKGEVSNLGRVRSFNRFVRCYLGKKRRLVYGRMLKLHAYDKYGHQSVHFGAVHVLVLVAWVGPCPPGMQCCHNDGNARNNWVGNLRWDTPENNRKDMVRHGSIACGRKLPNSKLYDEDVLRMCEMRRKGWSLRGLAARFGMATRNVKCVLAGTAYKHVKREPVYMRRCWAP